MCWWGESALVVASRRKHGFILLLYSRKHLDSQSLLLPPIRLPVGMRPLFMQVSIFVWFSGVSCCTAVEIQKVVHLRNKRKEDRRACENQQLFVRHF